ncbi:lipid A ABC transporter ATP-binding protein/permease MsbA [Candidatus Providencia siddallii]|uniref:Lipid A export ATP-binding/permease protein MsbA n=1 Tax=Candidatus Providencia siddallii TaxID=1715285 RepID=A0ABP1CE38_9GAMM
MDKKKLYIKKTFRRLWPNISPFKSRLIIASIALMINAASDAFMISLLKPLLDESFHKTENNIFKLLPIVVLGLITIRGISAFISTYCISWVAGKVVMNMRRKLFQHMIGMPVSFFDQQQTGTLLSRITYDSEQIASSSSGALITIIRESTYIVGLFIVMFYYNWLLSLILIIISPAVFITIHIVSNRFRQISKNMQTSMGNITSSTEQMLKGHKEILIFGGQKIETKRFNMISNNIRCQNMKMITASAISDPIIQLIASVALALILYSVSFPEIRNQLTPGTIAVIFSTMFALMRPLKSLTNVNSQFQQGMVASQTLFNILDSAQEKNEGTKILKTIKGNIEFVNVTFTYATKDHPTLEDISFKLPAGKSIALVGPSGSGKSTIVNLFTRFYEIDKGSIRIDGNDIRDYTLESLRNKVALVSQHVYLFNDTIANNIAYATNIDYSNELIEKAAKAAYAMDFVSKLDKGLNTIIGENGVTLSGGQRQRIAIARALLRDAPILILDEATSSLDTESERKIQSALNKLQKNRTSLIIAHRLSTIKNADEILVVQEGKIIERGDHITLLKKNGAYAHLHKIHFNQ